MSLLIFSYRKQQIIQLKANLNSKLMNLQQKIMDLQSYSSSISDSSVSMNDLMTSPSSMFNRMTGFMTFSHQASLAGTQQKMGMMQQSGILAQTLSQVAPNQQQAYQQMITKSIYNQCREDFGRKEKALLDRQETKITQEKARYEVQLKMLEAEESKINESESKAAKDSAPKFGLD